MTTYSEAQREIDRLQEIKKNYTITISDTGNKQDDTPLQKARRRAQHRAQEALDQGDAAAYDRYVSEMNEHYAALVRDGLRDHSNPAYASSVAHGFNLRTVGDWRTADGVFAYAQKYFAKTDLEVWKCLVNRAICAKDLGEHGRASELNREAFNLIPDDIPVINELINSFLAGDHEKTRAYLVELPRLVDFGPDSVARLAFLHDRELDPVKLAFPDVYREKIEPLLR